MQCSFLAPACHALAVAVLGLCVGSGSAWAQPCVKTVRWNPDKSTSARLLPDGVEASFNHDLLVEVLRRMGCTARFVGMPWARALLELENGRLDILPGAFDSEERRRYALFSVPVMRSPNVLFASRAASDKFKLDRLEALGEATAAGFRLGAQVGVAYGQAFDRLAADPALRARLVPVSSRESAWQMMRLGRLDGLIADETVGLNEVRDLSLQDAIVKTGVVVANEATRVAFSRKTIPERFVRDFDAAFATLVQDGTYKRLREQYVPCAVVAEKLGCR